MNSQWEDFCPPFSTSVVGLCTPEFAHSLYSETLKVQPHESFKILFQSPAFLFSPFCAWVGPARHGGVSSVPIAEILLLKSGLSRLDPMSEMELRIRLFHNPFTQLAQDWMYYSKQHKYCLSNSITN